MKFEKTNCFYDANRLGDILFVFHKNHKKYLESQLVDHDLSLIQAFCLVMIYECDSVNQKDLADGLYLTKGAITKAINKLEKLGLIIREKSDFDKRQYNLKVSPKGKTLIPEFLAINNKWEESIGVDDEFKEKLVIYALKSIELNSTQ